MDEDGRSISRNVGPRNLYQTETIHMFLKFLQITFIDPV